MMLLERGAMSSPETNHIVIPQLSEKADSPDLTNLTATQLQYLRYRQRFLQPEYRSTTARTELLAADMAHTVKEMVVMESVTTFSYDFDLTRHALTGDAYHEDLGVMATAFVQELEGRGLSSERSHIEWISLERLKNAIVAALTQDPSRQYRWIITSPPDEVSEGYFGTTSKHCWSAREKHHSFIFVYQAHLTSTGIHVEVKQYRTWHNMANLVELHHRLGAPFTPDRTQSITSQLFANIIHLECSPGQTDSDIDSWLREQFYQGHERWFMSHLDVPELRDPSALAAIEEAIWQKFYLPLALPLYEQLTQYRPDTDEYAQVLSQLEKLDSTYLAALLLQARALNTNPRYEWRTKLHMLRTALLKPQQATWLLGQLTKPQPATNLLQLTSDLEQIYSYQVQTLLSDGGSPSLVPPLSLSTSVMIGPTISGLQCVTVAPFTLPLSAANSLGKIDAGDWTRLTPTLSTAEKRHIWETVNDQDYVELDLRAQGANRVWMVPRSYLCGAGCRVEPDGMVSGPCLGPEGYIRFDDPLETAALAMNQAEFQSFVQQLQQHQLLANLDEVTSELQDHLPTAEQHTLTSLLVRLRSKILKPTIGLEELLNNDFIQPLAALDEIQQLNELLATHPTPLKIWQQLLEQLTRSPYQLPSLHILASD